MFKKIIPVVLCMATLGAGCTSEDDRQEWDTSTDQGRMVMHLATGDTPSDDYDPMRHLKVEVFNPQGEVIRRYDHTAAGTPLELKVVAGNYRVTAEAGESGKTQQMGYADFTKRKYRGEQTFTVSPGKTTQVDLVCKSVNVMAEVRFDESVAQHFGQNFSVTVADDTEYRQECIDRNEVAALKYTRSATGYFDLLDNEHTLVWKFTGHHPQEGAVETTGKIENTVMGGRYTLTFKYSPSAPGFVECFLLTVDPSAPEYDDTIIMNPGVTIVGSGFDVNACQEYRGEEKVFVVAGKKSITALSLTVNGRTLDLLAGSSAEGIRVEQNGDTQMTVTLSKPYFDTLGAGNHLITLAASDSGGGSTEQPVQFRLRGLITPTAADYDLWHNTLTLRYVEFESETDPIVFGLREKGASEWQTLTGERHDDGTYSVTFAPQWEESVNEAGLTVYAPRRATGIFARHTYECYGKAETEGLHTFTTDCTQAIPHHDMEAAIPAFTQSNANSSDWASGNNSFTSSLCTQAQFGGSKSAKLASTYYIMALASGNLYTGTFRAQGTGGTAAFGQGYAWVARPLSLKLRYHANIGTVNCVKHKKEGKDPIASGQPDKARIFVAVVDWDKRHEVTSSMKEVRGAWDPASATAQPEGKIIGYGMYDISGATEGEQMVDLEIPIRYYDTQVKPSKHIGLVISCAASAYGDYMNGCDTNVMYVDDFEWGY